MLVAIQNTGYKKTVEEVLASLKNDVYNKFKIDKSFGVDIIKSDDGEDGDAIEPSQQYASEIFHEESAFYIRILREPRKNQVLNALFVTLKSQEKMFLTPDSTSADIQCVIDVIKA